MTASPHSRRWISLGLLFDGQVPDDDPEYRLRMYGYGAPGRSVGTGGSGDPEDFGDDEEREEDGW
ncbi:hypothetical protein R1T08_14930 [Streptomyces sp. SBC-4]|nr:hypothetical protein [Streptomyces sp. SBC-4]MDV5145471.1 hypothetical protein [Streptomyces sp. SBC-4]